MASDTITPEHRTKCLCGSHAPLHPLRFARAGGPQRRERQRGARVAGVHTTPKGRSKGEFIAQTLAALEGAPGADAEGAAPRAVFVDDSASEVCDARVAGDERIFRILFQRSAL